MQDKRICSAPSAQTQRIERAIYRLLIAEDHLWRLSQLQQRIGEPLSLIAATTARLQADGLLDGDGKTTEADEINDFARSGQTVRASRAAIRADELTLYTFRPWNR
jgi:hypothetical protein